MCSKKIDIRKQAGFPEEQIRNPGREKESLLNATETAISLGNFQLSLNNIENSEIILKTTAAKVREIIRFKAISFYLVNEKDSSFYQAYCDPEDSSQFIEKEVKVLINEKIFSLALRANKPTIITSTASSEQIMLHPLFTSSRTRGMFLGVLEQDRENISDISLILFTTAIVINAYVLESYGLYHHIKDINKELEANVIKLEISEKELTKANNELQKDILKRKQTEEEKRRLEERLQHADKMEAIGTLAGGIAHDFNNLLMGIQGYTSLTLLNLDQDDPNRENLKRIEDQVQSGAELTRQLLGFARGGRYEVKPADMNEIIEKSSSMFGRTKKEITINKKYGDDLYAAEVDLGQMEQVLMNLYVNAWQAMPGGGNIYLETENVFLAEQQALTYAVKPGRYVKISVADTGIGMDEKTKARIFDPFFTTKAMGRGTGLGLATVYGVIKGHKGMIDVYSEPGNGTTFAIYLPASKKKIAKKKAETGAIVRGKETIMLVDDEKPVLEVTRELLDSLGYLVYAVGSGQEAIAIYTGKSKEIDLVILDMVMPGISGGETFERLREINPGVMVLLSTGYSLNEEAQTIMDRGCKGFLQKPFQLEKLSQKVREILD